MTTLYVIDSTARQYGFPVEGLKVKVLDEVYEVKGTADIDIFHDIMMNSDPFTLISSDGSFVAFSGNNLIGVKISSKE